jgi:hypothetical protein
MGCDYYICKQLSIYYKDDFVASFIELNIDRGYFYYPNIDSDDENYEKINNKYIKEQLTPHTEPIIIYENGAFNSSILEDKYKKLIEQELKMNNKSWTNILKIIKEETRYERD